MRLCFSFGKIDEHGWKLIYEILWVVPRCEKPDKAMSFPRSVVGVRQTNRAFGTRVADAKEGLKAFSRSNVPWQPKKRRGEPPQKTSVLWIFVFCYAWCMVFFAVWALTISTWFCSVWFFSCLFPCFPSFHSVYYKTLRPSVFLNEYYHGGLLFWSWENVFDGLSVYVPS